MLASHVFQSAKVMAFRHPLVGAPGVGFHGGPVILDHGHHVLRHTRYHQPVDRFDGHESVAARLPGQYVYAGPAYHHFGHVMSEMVHRLAASMDTFPRRKLLLAATVGDASYRTAINLPPFMQEVLGFFGVRLDQVSFLNRDQVVDDLFVAQQGSDFGGGPRPGYLDLLAGLTKKSLGDVHVQGHDKVYVSRSALPGGGGLLGECYFETALESVGFFVARPETMSLRQQMQLYRRARVLVFSEGSACHGVELLGTGSLGTVILLARRLDHMDIFGKVLSGRAEDYIPLKPTHAEVSIFRTMKHVTVGQIAICDLVRALNDRHVCGAIPFDEMAYARASKTDFDRHVSYFKTTCPDDVDDDLIASAHTTLSKFWR